MKLASAVEAKVASGVSVGGLVTLVFGLATVYHWFTPPPPYLTGLIVTLAGGVAGWLAPHTPRGQPAPAAGPAPAFTPAEVGTLKAHVVALTNPGPPLVQPPATTTGPAS